MPLSGRLLVSKCSFGRPHYQKVTGYEAVTSRFMSLRPATPAAIESTGVLIDCLDKCNIDHRCSGINYNSVKQTCVGIESDDGTSLTDPFVQQAMPRRNASDNFLLRPNSGIGYFESLCLQGNFFQTSKNLKISTVYMCSVSQWM